MAAPANMTSHNLSGKFVLNKQLSENTDEILKAQGVSWVARKAMGMAVPHLAIAHTPAGTGTGAEELAITIGVQGQSRSERRVLDGAERVQEGGPAGAGAGAVRVANARAPLDAVAGGLREGWLPESFVDGKVVHVRAKGEAGWVMEQVWGFQMLGGEKRHVRKMHLTSTKGEVVEGRMVYDYEGPL